jgi:hypothetical protein
VTEFNPPISSRDTDELIAIANGTTDDWQQDAINQAIDELKRRNVTREHQDRILDKWKKKDEELELAYQRQLEQNETEGYSTGKMIYIFFVAPFILVGRWTVDLSLRELKKENYQKKFKQRLFLLLSGTTFWILFMVASAKDYGRKRQEEIDKVDISEWEKNYYGNDSLTTEDNKNKENE